MVAGKTTVPVLLGPRTCDAVGAFHHVAVTISISGPAGRGGTRVDIASDTADRITLLHVVPEFSSGVPPNMYRYTVAGPVSWCVMPVGV